MNTKIIRHQADGDVMRIGLAFACLLWLGVNCVTQAATTRYVALGGTNDAGGGYTSWSGAATNIQLAVNASTNGDTVLVSNGVYMLTNEISIATNLTIRSDKNGAVDRDGTIINGNNFAGKPVTNRCFYLNHAGALVEGFTITNGYTWANGGGVYVNAGTLRNCLVTGNTAGTNYGGGVYATSASSLITNCEVVGNLVEFYGGGVFLDSSAQLWNSRINYNSATRQTADPRGGGVYINSSSMFNCIIISNTLPYINCTYGGGICAFASTVRNCLVMGNWSFGAGGVRLYNSSTIDSCTIVSNTGYYSGLVVSQPANFVRNTISCWNSKNDVVDTGANNYFTNCSFNIFWDLETRVYPPWRGSGNIDTNNPGFVSPAGQNYRLAKGSPCINKGLNQDWMTTASDLDGRSRVDRFSRQVDVGAYEFLPSGTMFTVY